MAKILKKDHFKAYFFLKISLIHPMLNPMTTAKKIEWVNPRCPKGFEYGILNQKASTSKSGKKARKLKKSIVFK